MGRRRGGCCWKGNKRACVCLSVGGDSLCSSMNACDRFVWEEVCYYEELANWYNEKGINNKEYIAKH